MQLIDMREMVSNIVCEWFFHCCPLVGYEKGLNGSLEPEPGSNGGGRGSKETENMRVRRQLMWKKQLNCCNANTM